MRAKRINGHATAATAVPDAVRQHTYVTEGQVTDPPQTIEATVTCFRKYLHLPDAGALEIVLGTVAANMLMGKPVWLLLVGAPGSGKTVLLESLTDLPHIHFASTFTESSLLSATPKRDRTSTSTGGLLNTIGDFGILIHKDFTSVLAMNRDARMSTLAALREIYDGHWTRHKGVDGGRTFEWKGKVGLLAACTPTIDTHHAVMAAMGERFLLYRVPNIDERAVVERAIEQNNNPTSKEALANNVKLLLSTISRNAQPCNLDDKDRERLVALAMLVAHGRSSVERNGRTREIEFVPEPETPTRLAQSLSSLRAGLAAIGIQEVRAWQLLVKTGLDCIPATRRRTLGLLLQSKSGFCQQEIAKRLNLPPQTVRRTLEDLAAHDVLSSSSARDIWRASDWVHDQYLSATGERSRNVGKAELDSATAPEESINRNRT